MLYLLYHKYFCELLPKQEGFNAITIIHSSRIELLDQIFYHNTPRPIPKPYFYFLEQGGQAIIIKIQYNNINVINVYKKFSSNV